MESNKLSHYIQKGYQGYEQFINEIKKLDNIIPGIFLHSLYYNSENSLKLAQKCNSNHSKFISVHVAETMESVLKAKQKWGCSSIDVLENYKLLGNNTILIHGGFLDHNDLKKISERCSSIVLCPISNKKLNTKCINPLTLENMGIEWCIATDGVGTGRTMNLFEHLKVAKKIFDLSNNKIIECVTKKPAKMLGISKKIGTIDIGKHADFMVINGCKNDNFNEIVDWLLNYQSEIKIDTYVKGKKINKIKIDKMPHFLPPKFIEVTSYKSIF
jgi:cytosine/adenosine deaminase-related metal-dependent hydrolase